MPDSIKETILCLLPIKDAARTGILAKCWRYEWTKICWRYEWTKIKSLVLDFAELRPYDEELGGERATMPDRCKFFYSIFQVLFTHNGPAFKFFLTMEALTTSNEIDQVLRFLASRDSVNKLASIQAGCFPKLETLLLLAVVLSANTLMLLLSCSPFLTEVHSATDQIDDVEGFMLNSLFAALITAEMLFTYHATILAARFEVEEIVHSQCTTLKRIEDYDSQIPELRVFEISDVTNQRGIMKFIKLVYANSPLLERVKIVPSYQLSDDEKMVIKNLVSAYTFASTDVVFTFL